MPRNNSRYAQEEPEVLTTAEFENNSQQDDDIEVDEPATHQTEVAQEINTDIEIDQGESNYYLNNLFSSDSGIFHILFIQFIFVYTCH